MGIRVSCGLVVSCAVCACSSDMLSRVDGGADAGAGTGTDAGPGADGGADSGFADAGHADSGAARPDAGPFACDPLAPTGDPARGAAVTGMIEVIDYDAYDPRASGRRRDRNAGWNFLTGTLVPRPPSGGPLFTSLPRDRCAVFEIPNDVRNLGPARNVGTELVLTSTGVAPMRFARVSDGGMVRYRAATQMDTVRFFDRMRTPLDARWTWSTPGDALAGVRPARAEVRPVEDFEVDPPISATATTAPVVIDARGMRFRWTAPRVTPAEITLELGRALNERGDARYVLCRPLDDGEFTIPADAIADLGATPGRAFGVAIARTQLAPFCNEGVTSGVALHALVYLGAAVIP